MTQLSLTYCQNHRKALSTALRGRAILVVSNHGSGEQDGKFFSKHMFLCKKINLLQKLGRIKGSSDFACAVLFDKARNMLSPCKTNGVLKLPYCLKSCRMTSSDR